MTEERDEILKILKNIITNEKNAIIIEKAVFENSSNYSKDAYDIIGMIIEKKFGLKEILSSIKEKNFGFDSLVFNNAATQKMIENIRDTRPTEITEGIYKCKNCGNKKIVTNSLQTRGGDEAMTHYFTCVTCGTRWKRG